MQCDPVLPTINKEIYCKKYKDFSYRAIKKCFGRGPSCIKINRQCIEWYRDGDQKNHITFYMKTCPDYCKYRTPAEVENATVSFA